MQPRTRVANLLGKGLTDNCAGLGLGLVLGLALSLSGACRSEFSEDCPEGQRTCVCVGGEGGTCLAGLVCTSGVCVDEGGETGETSGEASSTESATEGATSGEACDGPSGSTTEGAQQAMMLAGEMHARKVTVDCEGRLVSVALHSPNGFALLTRAAVYADDAGTPAAKVADTASNSNPGGGWLDLDADQVLLQPGDYWIGFIIADGPGSDLASFSYAEVPSGESVSAPASFGAPPDFFPDLVTASTRGWSAYMVLEAP